MTGLIIHPQTATALSGFVAQPSHALILSGAVGSGKFSMARQLSEQLLGLAPESLETYPYGRVVQSPDGKAIGIEAVRELEHFLSLKVPGRQTPNRVVVIADAQLLTTEAQNALLKTIEEPPRGTILLLTVSHEQALLATIRSRAQIISVKRPPETLLNDYFTEQGYAAQDIKRALAMSGGLPGLANALLSDADHPLVPAALKARELLAQSTFERLTHLDELAQQRSLCLDTLFILQQMALVSLPTATGAMIERWQRILLASRQTSDNLRHGAQPKLALTDFLLHL